MNIELYSVDQYPLDFEESWSLSILKQLSYLIHYPLLIWSAVRDFVNKPEKNIKTFQ